jgi:hypothetical protein
LVDTRGADLPPEEAKIAKEQSDEMIKLWKSLDQPVQKGDMKAARARVDSLQKQFEGLSADNKKYMYNMLQTKNGPADEFHYRLSSPSRDKLLKTLNPEHKEDHIQKYTLNDAKEKAQKNLELNMQGTTKKQELEKFIIPMQKKVEKRMEEFENRTDEQKMKMEKLENAMDEQNKKQKEIIQNIAR